MITDKNSNNPYCQKKRKKWPFVVGGVSLFLFIVYWVLVYFLVSAALVPSFMKKLDAFSEVTEKGIAGQVHTTEVQENHRKAIEETNNWLKTVKHKKYRITSRDGYELVAMEFEPEPVSGSAVGTEKTEKESESSSAGVKKNEHTDAHNWVLVLHGYTGWKEEMYPFAMEYVKRGYHALVPDLRCQGESDGDFIGMGLTDSVDCLLWLEGIRKLDPEARVVIHGQSMGAATALIMSGMSDLPSYVRAIVSDCSYTDAYEMFEAKIGDWFSLPAFPLVDSARWMLMLRGGYDLYFASAIDAVKRSHTPTLFIHGTDDQMISPEMSRELYDAEACEKKELLLVEGAGHAQSQDKNPDLYYETIFRFLE